MAHEHEGRWKDTDKVKAMCVGYKITLNNGSIQYFDSLATPKRYKKLKNTSPLEAFYGRRWPEENIYSVEKYDLYEVNGSPQLYFKDTNTWE